MVLVSHRSITVPNAFIGLHRAISKTFLVRYAELHGVVQDERLTKKSVGVDSEMSRSVFKIALEGSSCEFSDQTEILLAAGDAVFLPEASAVNARWFGKVLEIEWNRVNTKTAKGGRYTQTATKLRLGKCVLKGARAFALRLQQAGKGPDLYEDLERLVTLLEVEALGFASGIERQTCCEADQALMNAVDAALSDLHVSPMLIDIEAETGQARRTLTRNIRGLHERNALLGRGAGRWRGMRDTQRLVIAGILSSHPSMTPRQIAGHVGYGSVEALDHAFRQASLHSPRELCRAVRAIDTSSISSGSC
jgi:AraC-like DNA-binding protein